MKGVLNLTRPIYAWIKEYFPTYDAYMLPFLGKPLIEFYIDYCSLSGIGELLLLLEDNSMELKNYLGDGTKWGLKITYNNTLSSKDIEMIRSQNATFLGLEPALYINGFFFPLYDKNACEGKKDLAPWNLSRIQFFPKLANARLFPLEEIEIDSILRYYNLNMELLKNHSSQLLMKGYSAEPGVFMGMNNSIERRAKLIPPFVSGDDVQVLDRAQIGPNAIIGDTCIIDDRTLLQNSIILSQTYVGADLNLDKKIVYQNNIIDPIAGITVSFADSTFSSRLEGNLVSQWARQCITSCFAALFIVLMSPVYLFFRCVGRPPCKWVTYQQKNGRISSHPLPFYAKGTEWREEWFFRLSIDRFHPLLHALMGRIYLIGDTLWDTQTQADIITQYKDYRPGALTYTDSVGETDFYAKVNGDLYYKHHRNLQTDIVLVCRTFLSKLFRSISSDEKI